MDRLNLSGTNLQYSLSNQGNDCFSEALRDLDEHAHPSPSSLATNIIEVMEILLLFVSQKAVRCKCISQLSFTLINASCCRERHQVLRTKCYDNHQNACRQKCESNWYQEEVLMKNTLCINVFYR